MCGCVQGKKYMLIFSHEMAEFDQLEIIPRCRSIQEVSGEDHS